MCGGIVNNQINKGLLLSLSENFFNLNVWHNYVQKGGLGHALSSPDFYCYFWAYPLLLFSFLVLHFLVCCQTTLWNINVTKQANNNKLQGSVAAYLRCGGLSVTKLRKVYCWVCQWNFFFKSANIWQLQARRCLSRALCVPGHHTAERWRKCSLGHALSSHPSWSLDILYHLLPFTAINSILFVFLRAWQSSRTTSFQVVSGLPLGLGPSTSYSIHFFTQLEKPVRYEKRCYADVRSKAYMSQINLQQGIQWRTGRLKSKNRYAQKYR